MEKNIKKIDPRVVRTQKIIVDTFFDLLNEKSFNSITIIDICDRAMINRGTFYSHFEDKYQLLSHCIYDIMKGFDEQVEKVDMSGDIVKYYKEILELVIKFLRPRRNRIRTIMLKSNSAFVLDNVHKFLIINITRKVKALKESGKTITIPTDMLAEFFAGGLVSLAKWWILYDTRYTIEQISDYLVKLAQFTLEDYIIPINNC